jgi:uncharacterized protein
MLYICVGNKNKKFNFEVENQVKFIFFNQNPIKRAMPYAQTTYKAPWFCRNTHLQTMYAGRFRRIQPIDYQRERVELPDGDFIDLDWLANQHKKLVIVCHGLGGNSQRPHVRGIIRAFSETDFDHCVINFRGESGEPNRLLKTYHCGISDDLKHVIEHILANKQYEEIYLSGYSLGGNVILKYLGEQGTNVPKAIKKAAVMSVPCHLKDSSAQISRWYNRVYVYDFMQDLSAKIQKKALQFANEIDVSCITPYSNFYEFDNYYTAPSGGFRNANDYYERASSLPFLNNITVPTLLLQAEDDTFISNTSIPKEIAEKHPFLHLEVSRNGGHVGFVRFAEDGLSWAEKRFRDFFK